MQPMTTDLITTRQAAERLGVSVQYFHRLTVSRGIEPAFVAPRDRGEKLWAPADIDTLATERAAAKP